MQVQVNRSCIAVPVLSLNECTLACHCLVQGQMRGGVKEACGTGAFVWREERGDSRQGAGARGARAERREADGRHRRRDQSRVRLESSQLGRARGAAQVRFQDDGCGEDGGLTRGHPAVARTHPPVRRRWTHRARLLRPTTSLTTHTLSLISTRARIVIAPNTHTLSYSWMFSSNFVLLYAKIKITASFS